MSIFGEVASVVGLVGGICGIGSLYYSRRQTNVVVEDHNERKKQAEEDDHWAQRFDRLQSRLLRINQRLQVQVNNSGGLISLYMTMFADQELRLRVESTIVSSDAQHNMLFARRPSQLELRSSSMRDTIQRAEEAMDDIIKQFPAAGYHLLGPELMAKAKAETQTASSPKSR